MIMSARFSLLVTAFLASYACGGGSDGASPAGPSAATVSTPTPVAATPAPTATPAATPIPTPVSTPQPTPTATPVPPTPTTLRRASMSGAAGHQSSGGVAIIRTGSSVDLVFEQNFQVDGGVNDVILSTRSDSMSGGMNLGALRALGGQQSYSMRNDGSDYRYVILWCRPFQVVIGFGELR